MNIFPESDSSESSESESPEALEITLMRDISDETTPKTSQSYCLPLQPFIANTGLITDIQDTKVIFLCEFIYLHT